MILEDYYNNKMKEMLLRYSNEIKTGIIGFYYSATEEEKREFYEELNNLKKNGEDLEILINQINSKFGKNF